MPGIGIGLAGARLGLGLAQGAGAAAAVRWWVTTTLLADDALTVFQPKGAVSEEASYLDLTGNGRHVSYRWVFSQYGIDEVLPIAQHVEWSAEIGWHWPDSSRYLCFPSTFFPMSHWSTFIVVKNAPGVSFGQSRPFGCRYAGGNRYYIYNVNSTTAVFGNGTAAIVGTACENGDLCLSGTSFNAINGNQFTTGSGFANTINVPMLFGAMSDNNTRSIVGVNSNYFRGDITCFAMWNRPLTWQEYLDVRTQVIAAGLL